MAFEAVVAEVRAPEVVGWRISKYSATPRGEAKLWVLAEKNLSLP